MDKLKTTVPNLDGIDKAFHSLYKKAKEGEGYVFVGVDDSDAMKESKDALAKASENNTKLTKDMEELILKSKDVDPAKYAEMKAKLDKIKEGELIEQGKIPELIEQRTESMRKESAGKIKALETTAAEATARADKNQAQLNTITVNNAVTQAITDVAVVKKGALSDILARASVVWAVGDDGVLAAKDADGNVQYGKEGKEPIKVTEWATNLVADAPFLFESNKGGASPGSTSAGVTGKTIAFGDKAAMAANLEKVASGEISVAQQ